MKKWVAFILIVTLISGLCQVSVSAETANYTITLDDYFVIDSDSEGENEDFNSVDSPIRQFPFLEKVGDTLIASWSQHTDTAEAVSNDSIMISRDGGKTWGEKQTKQYFYLTSIIKRNDGTLFGMNYYPHYVDSHNATVFYHISNDDGANWESKRGNIYFADEIRTNGDAWSSMVMHRSMYEDADGNLYALMYGRYKADTDFRRVIIVKSTDDGANWSHYSTIASGAPLDGNGNALTTDGGITGYVEPVLTHCADGSMLCVMRIGSNQPLYQTRSFDNGLTWTTPTTLPGMTNLSDTYSVDPDLELMSDGTLILTYGRPNLKMLVSLDGCGYKWQNNPTVLREGSSGYSGVREISPGKLIVIGDNGTHNTTVNYEIWGRYVNVSRNTVSAPTIVDSVFESNKKIVATGEAGTKLTFKAIDSNGNLTTYDNLEYVVSNNVISVDADGNVSALRSGTATIYAQCSKNGVVYKSAPITITVESDNPFITTFEKDTAGEIPSGMTAYCGTTTESTNKQFINVSTDQAASGTKSVHFNDNASDRLVRLRLDSQTAPTKKTLYFKVFPVNLTNSFCVRIYSDNSYGPYIYSISLSSTGSVDFYNGSSWNMLLPAGTVKLNEWNTIKLGFDISDMSISANCNDVEGTVSNTQSITPVSIKGIEFASGSTSGVDCEVYIDDVSVSNRLLGDDEDAFNAWDGSVATEFANGEGTSDSPYEISDESELALARNLINDGTKSGAYFKLTSDIDLSELEWEPIGFNNAFSGNLDGNGHTIKNISITTEAGADGSAHRHYPNQGFFSQITGTVKNLGLDGVSVLNNSNNESRASGVGAFAGMISGTVSGCFVKNAIVKQCNRDKTETCTAGFVGNVCKGANISECYIYNAKICSGQSAPQGGFYGRGDNSNILIKNCYAADVYEDTSDTSHPTNSSAFYAFGHRKYASSDKISNCYSTAEDTLGTQNNYDGTYTSGTIGTLKEGLAAELLKVGYTSSSEINNGYPCLAWEIWDGKPAEAFAGGSGTASSPYQISNAAELLLASNRVNAGETGLCFELVSDIDYCNYEWISIGTSSTRYNATFKGNGHIVKNLKITNTLANVGFFGVLADRANISRLGIENMQIEIRNDGTSTFMGGFVSRAGGTIDECYIKNSSVRTLTRDYKEHSLGAFAGSGRSNATIKNSYAYNVRICAGTQTSIAGFIGQFEGENVTVENCYASEIRVDMSGADDTVTASPAYGFGTINGKTTYTITNCHTTLADSGVLASNSMVSEISDKITMCDNLITENSVFKYDDTLCLGYPSLKWQASGSDAQYIITAVSYTNGIKAKLTEQIPVSDASVYFVTYDSTGRMIDADVAEQAIEVASTIETSETDELRIFVWNSDNSPLAVPYIK